MYFFRDVVGEAAVSKEVLSRHTNEYQAWVEAFAAITVRSNGPGRESARRITSVPRCPGWSGKTVTAFSSSSRAWSR
jgi:hypothetical protein